MREACFEDTLPRVRLQNGARALVTGATGGIGGAIARALHARGAHRGPERPPRGRPRGAAAEPRRARRGGRGRPRRARRPGPARGGGRRGRRARGERGPAGEREASRTSIPTRSTASIDVNLRAPIQLTRALLPGMLERGRGHVVLVSSLSGKVASPRSGLYSATKFGLRGFAAGLREDVEPLGIGVTVVFPGFVSDAGFFAESGVKLPRWVGTRTPEQVADGGGARHRARARGGGRGAAQPARSARASRSWRRSPPRACSGGSARSGSPTSSPTPSATSADSGLPDQG